MQGQDRELIAAFLEGEPEALSLVDSWISVAAQPFRRRLSATWDDQLQDVRYEVTRLLKADKFRGDSALKTYVWRVTSHACLDEVRRLSRWRLTDLEALPGRLTETPPTAYDRLKRSDQRNLAKRVLDEVSDDCRRLWQMLLQGMSYAEMSEAIGIAAGTLRVRVLRCRQRATALRDQWVEEESVIW